MVKKLILISTFLSALSLRAYALDTLSYSGRLVNTNGSPVTGPVNLRFDLSSTDDPGTTLCTKSITGVPLSNGVFHVKLKFDPPDCSGTSLQNLMESVPAGHNMTYQVTDTTNSRTYAIQNMYAVPSSYMSNYAKNLPQMGALPDQVLKWNDTLKRWVPGDAGTGSGSVTQINTDSSLTGGPITETGTLAVAPGGITNAHLAGGIDPSKLAGTRDGTNYLKGDNTWGDFGSDVLNTILNGFSAASSSVVTATDSILTAIEKLQGQASDLSNNKLDKTGGTLVVGTINGVPTPLLPDQIVNKQYVDDQLGGVNSSQWIDAVPHIYFNTGNVGIGTGTPNEKLDVVGNIALTGSLRLQDSGSNFVELRAPLTTAGVTFTLPATPGTNGQVLKTDGTGILSWGNSSVGSSDITDGSIVDADVSATANIAQSKIANLTSDLAGKEPTIAGGTTAQFWRGDKTWQTLNTDAVPEGATNKYFTNTLARGAISGASPISYNSGTGVIGMVPGTTGDLLQYNGSAWVPWSPNFLSAEADTLATVTARGSTTSTPVVFSGGANFPGTGIWNTSGNVGIGTNTPRSKLDVIGGVQIGADAVACVAAKAGTIRYNGGNVEYCNGSNWLAFGVSGSGITNFNGSTVGSHSFAAPGTTGTAPNWVTVPATGVHTLNIPMASAAGVTAGLISKADYDDFKDVADGFNVASLVGNRIMVSTATTIVEAPALTNGQLLIGSTGATPVAATLTAGTGVSITNSAGGITINATGSGGTISALTGDVTASGTGSVAATIANDAVTSAKILDGTIVNADIANSTITYGKLNLADGTIPIAKLVRMTCLPGEVITSDVALGYRCVADSATDTTKLPLAGGTMTGAITLAGNPTANLHAATKQYVDTAITGVASVWSTSGTNIHNNNTGNVGIGTSNPYGKLHILNGTNVHENNSSTVNSSSIHFTKSRSNGIVSINDYLGMIDFRGHDSFGDRISARISAEVDGTPGLNDMPGRLTFHTTPDGAILTSERMRITNAGDVGIGTTAPGAKLEVAGQVKITGGSPGSGKVLTSDASGLATWQTPAAGGDFKSDGTVAMTGAFRAADGSAASPSISFSSSPATGFYNLAGNILFSHNGTARFGMDNSSMYGIGGSVWRFSYTNTAAAPAITLDNANTGFYRPAASTIGFSTAGNERMRIDATGNVGIGTTTPGAKLEVAGQVKITGGTPGAGKVLTSDASGLATWQTAGGSDNLGNHTATQNIILGSNWINGDSDSEGLSVNSWGQVKASGSVMQPMFTVESNGGGTDYIFKMDNNSNDRGYILFENLLSSGALEYFGVKANDFILGTDGLERLVVKSDGKVGIGISSPNSTLQVNGSIASVAVNDTTPTSFNMAAGNYQYTATGCSGATWTLTNMVEGTSYTIAVQNNSHSGSCVFSDGSSTFKYRPANATPTSGHVIYSFVKYGSFVYISWIDGF
ncbi:beta strand repeat-containing protein [Peredibacter starrii]|uniref:Uncharacterized protein n=1 Tax=Peredibacter starrii TaxID=28202 RepID=A0AAX4HKH6_9BACT|nr:hypothetical protein [Peredibacter starrii]WPU63723.1 hypothetical protein SOO65_13595 [Peredibacter starrii]